MPKKGSVKRMGTMPVWRSIIIQDTYSMTNNLTGPKKYGIDFVFFYMGGYQASFPNKSKK